jgi:hypothetical protein
MESPVLTHITSGSVNPGLVKSLCITNMYGLILIFVDVD